MYGIEWCAVKTRLVLADPVWRPAVFPGAVATKHLVSRGRGLVAPAAGNTPTMDDGLGLGDRDWLEVSGRVAAELAADLRGEAFEVYLAEAARTRVMDRRPTGSEGPTEIQVTLRCGHVVAGAIDDADPVSDALTVVATGGRRLLIPVGAAVTLTGLPRRLRDEGGPTVTASIGSRLRMAAADAPVRVLLRTGGWIAGDVAFVGADHVDLVSAGRVVTVPFSSVDAWHLAAPDASVG